MDLFERLGLCSFVIAFLEQMKIKHEELGVDFEKVLLTWIKTTYKNVDEV